MKVFLSLGGEHRHFFIAQDGHRHNWCLGRH